MTVIPAAAMRNPIDEPGPEPKNIVSSGHLLEEIASIVRGRVANEDAATMNRTDTRNVTAEILARLIADTYKKVDLLGWVDTRHENPGKLSQVMSHGIKLVQDKHYANTLRVMGDIDIATIIGVIMVVMIPFFIQNIFAYVLGSIAGVFSTWRVIQGFRFKAKAKRYAEAIPAQSAAFCAAVDEYVDEIRQQLQAQTATVESPESPAIPQ